MNCWHCNTELIWGGDHDIEEENEDYLKNTKFYAFSQTNESNDRKNDTYTQFLNKIIPRTKTLFNLIKKYMEYFELIIKKSLLLIRNIPS